MIAVLVSLLVPLQKTPDFDFDLRSGEGLTLRIRDVPLVLGSGLQYIEPGWTKGYYSTTNGNQTIQKPDADTIEMAFEGADGQAKGSERVHRDGDRLTAHYHLEWTGEHPVEVELTGGLIWAPALRAGTLTADGKPTRGLDVTGYVPDQDMEKRRYAPDAKLLQFQAPVGIVETSSSLPMTLFDARGYRQDYAAGRSVWWYGALGIDIAKGKPIDVDLTWTVRPSPSAEPFLVTKHVVLADNPNAAAPDEVIAPLIPKPKTANLDYGKPTSITNLFTFPAGRVRYWDLYKEALSRRFDVPAPAKGAKPLKIDGGISKLNLHPGGYTIDITSDSISVLGEEDDGLRNGFYRLAQLAFVKNGQLFVPSGHIEDEPHTSWRGVHLFGGPEAREFQKRLWDRVLLPLGMNKVVVQCERTDWKSTPIDASEHPMSREDLVGLFDDYRKVGVEPIPLIQSLGHMEWFFAGKKRLDLAVNPDQPYTIDPRKKGTKAATVAMWDEAIALLKPAAIHFGCDEIDQVGMSPHDPDLTTDIWRAQMATLGQIARTHGVTMMIWGDEALAPGEAVDAVNGDSKQEAANRRAVIPEGATICDWHYAPNPDPAKYYPTLQLWKREGLNPIASAWYQPENIRGFNLAADLEHVGTLQTTWVGYESNERGLIDHPESFVAMISAADYSWSARQDPADHLGYDPALVFRKLYFGSPSPVSSESGAAVRWPGNFREVRIGTTTFQIGTPIELRSVISPGLANAPTTLVLDVASTPSNNVSLRNVFMGKARHLSLAMDTVETLAENEPVADLEVELEDGERVSKRLVYGHHLRAASDVRMTPYAERGTGMCAVQLDLGRLSAVKSIKVQALGAKAGVRLFGATIW